MSTEVPARIGRVVHAHRTAQNRSVAELARAAGLSKTIVARLERGEGNPSIETLWKVSQALELPLGALVADDAGPRTRVIRAGEGEALASGSGMVARLLHARSSAARAEVFALELPRGAEQGSDPHLPATEELVVCVRGRLLAGPIGAEAELAAGDALWFAADVPHRYVARTAVSALNWMLYGSGAR